MSEVKKKQVGTKVTETIIGTAANKLSSALSQVADAVKSLDKFEEIITQKTLEVVNLETKAEQLSQDLSNKIAQNKIEASLAFAQNEQEFVDQFARKNSLSLVETIQLKALEDQVNSLKSEMRNEIAKQVSIEKSSLERDYKHKTELDAEKLKAEQASNVATIESLKTQLAAARSEADSWKEALNKEREAATERSKHSAVGTISVTGPSK